MAAAAAPALGAVRGAGRMAAWRAHAYGALDELRLEAARVPALRAPDDVLVRVAASSINPLDVAMLGGYGSRVLNALRSVEGAEGAEGVEFPLVCGRDFAGTAVRCGPAARLRPGARVWGVLPPHRPGAHADYVLVRDRWAGPAPSTLDDLQAGGALYAALSASAALRAGGLRATARAARVLLLGLGGVGHAALQLLVAAGARVIVGCAGEQCDRALALGAAAALDRHAPDYARLLEDSGPYEVILDCAGLGGAEAGARRWRFGRYVTLTTPLLRDTDARGLLAGTAVATATLLAQGAAAARAGGGAGACPPHVRWAYFAPNADDIEHLRKLAEQGKFCVQVEETFEWWRAREAFERAARGSARGKLLLDFRAQPRH
ncbi:reticulon-4-interacting protein 1 homolog, mitochondrial [Ostrinia furnacalis]|uniref:reticulon-4-interacting protein 1 homolog, mitochondrial n=1 Tax=Ostrinia furnacalis TaxID=93504 RepID=UPI00103E7C8D|nr:reticulon-4-interacting protein 1 homolog, mitochondrial [Ostrinia furnacalis]